MRKEALSVLFIEFAPQELWGAMLSLQGTEQSSAVTESEVVYHSNREILS